MKRKISQFVWLILALSGCRSSLGTDVRSGRTGATLPTEAATSFSVNTDSNGGTYEAKSLEWTGLTLAVPANFCAACTIVVEQAASPLANYEIVALTIRAEGDVSKGASLSVKLPDFFVADIDEHDFVLDGIAAAAAPENATIDLQFDGGELHRLSVRSRPKISIESPAVNAVIDRANVSSFPLKGNCENADGASVMLGTETVAECVDGPWAATLNLSALAEGDQVVEVNLVSDDGAVLAQDRRTYVKDTSPPGKVTLVDPSATTIQPIAKIQWSGAGDAKTYQVSVSASEDCAAPLVSMSATQAMVVTLPAAISLPGLYYICIVASDAADNATASVFPVTLFGARHEGWTDVRSVGRQTTNTDAVLNPASLKIAWRPMTVKPQDPDSYDVYRSTSAGTTGDLRANVPASASPAFADGEVAAATIYYYTVVPRHGSLAVPTSETYSQIKVVSPPDNMALVHRWVANQEMCDLMHLTSDPSHDYRCAYSGLGSTGGYVDVGHSFLVDIAMTGCNATPAPACGDAVKGCSGDVGSSPPSALIGNPGDVFFNTGGANGCFVKRSDGTWHTASNTAAGSTLVRYSTDDDMQSLASPKSNLPLLSSYLTSGDLEAACSVQTVPMFNGNKRLLSRREYVAAAAWSPELSPADITGLIANAVPATTKGCTNVVSGLTGHSSRSACVSRYGIQDLVGDYFAANSDQLTCAANSTCLGIASTVDPANSDIAGLDFGSLMGSTMITTSAPYGFGPDVTASLSAYGLSGMSLPLGIPLSSASVISEKGLAFGVGPDAFDPAKMGAAYIAFEAQNVWGPPAWVPEPRFIYSGDRGRFSIGARFNEGEVWVGSRCGVTVPN